jgi:CHAD domain-containing protein
VKHDLKKLLLQLAKLRRRAGRVRDVDVQIVALRTVQIGRYEETKSRLMSELELQRGKREKKLLAGIDEKFSPRLRERMRKVGSAIALTGGAASQGSDISTDRLWRAVRDLIRTARQAQPFSLRGLHQFRIQAKKTRYLAELLPGNAVLLQQLKTIQDVIGDWHDWLTLAQNAAKIAEPSELALRAHLENVTHAKFTQAVRVCKRTISEIEAGVSALQPRPRKKQAMPEKKKRPSEKKKQPAHADILNGEQAAPAAG